DHDVVSRFDTADDRVAVSNDANRDPRNSAGRVERPVFRYNGRQLAKRARELVADCTFVDDAPTGVERDTITFGNVRQQDVRDHRETGLARDDRGIARDAFVGADDPPESCRIAAELAVEVGGDG